MSFYDVKGQMPLGIQRDQEKDRNHHLGGRSFYFFDFDDNIAFLSTPLILFHRDTKQEVNISSSDFAKFHHQIGKDGIYKDFVIDYCDNSGTFRNFRDRHIHELEALDGKRQVFLEDVAHALGFPDFHWKGPSWECFYHATFNQRPVSVITARGHSPETIKNGISLFVQQSHLPVEPNYLSIYPVSHKKTRLELGDFDFNMSVAQLKQRAINASVRRAIDVYGYSDHHRFGMSDDDPKNVNLIIEEMTKLKADFPKISFFVIETINGQFIKHEITQSGTRSKELGNSSENFAQNLVDKCIPQLSLFDKA